MNVNRKFKPLWIIFILISSFAFAQMESVPVGNPKLATGYVYDDSNQNKMWDEGEKGIPGIKVSNGQEIVKTDENGYYTIACDEDTIIFLIKPQGWKTPINENNLPQFYYIHKPNGSPPQKYPGVQPTGPLPESINFPLYPNHEPEQFHAILFGDTQPRNQEEVNYIAHDVVEELIGTDASFGVTLGDIVFDDLSVMPSLNKVIALIGIPWYNVLGNHDQNYDSPDDKYSNETYESIYGPSYYSYDYGPVHFMVLDDVTWYGATSSERGHYKGGLGERQMEFIKNDLSLIPENQLVVLMMHIPLTSVEDRQDLYRLIENRPFSLSISAHTHNQQHRFITKEDGWMGPEPHHHLINVTVCGSWWSGAPDELGIPNATMNDGAPNGYSIIHFDGHQYSLEYKAARRPASHQMSIYAPDEILSSDSIATEVIVNVFFGSEKSTVEMKFGEEGEWISMEKVNMEDPFLERMKKLEESPKPPPGRKLPNPGKSTHIWKASLPLNPKPGTYFIHIRTTDMWNHTYTDQRVIQIR